jgi:carboxymethylenebutenolidase
MNEIQLPFYIAQPISEPPWPGVVVIGRGNGIDAWTAHFCEYLAMHGHAALAPNMFYRAPRDADLKERFASLNIDLEIGGAHDYFVKSESAAALSTMNEAASLLRGFGAARLGVMGFCTGGNFTYQAAKASDQFSAAVALYGAQIDRYLGQPMCPTLILFGREDEYMTHDRIQAVVDHHPDTIVYPGIGHGYMHDYLDTYDEKAYQDSCDRILSFFAEHLL